KEVCSMKKEGPQIEIITPHESTEIKEFEGIKVHCVETKGPPGMVALKIIKKALKTEYDLFYCHELDPLLYSIVLKRITRKPVVWDCHEYIVPMKMELQGKLSAILTNIGMAICAPKVDHIITVDNRLAKTLSRFGKVTVVPNYPRLSDFSDDWKSETDQKFVVLYVGGLTERRGIKVILKAMKKLKDREIILRVAGGFYDKELEEWAHKYNSENELNIEWLGWVDYRKLAPVIASSDCGLFVNQPGPRYLKGLPTKIFEYMIMGLPVVSATGPLLDSLINGKNLGITVDSTDPEALSKGIESLMKNSNLQGMGRKAHNTVKKNYCWETKENKLLKIIDKLTS
ncbi:MAG: glycosyltransferase family 4 protein, partial [Candidatus Thermoplasmatota archaeon]|nr:glycosyltransferase family 4 protein [Candidatus Thermoplasmatota archaeon]